MEHKLDLVFIGFVGLFVCLVGWLAGWLVGLYINHCRLFNAKSISYV